ncbi:hypothetical protein F5Y01DRAFT_325656 [Xylaria sp. FL0043]|nr:hypothetical protein F5Y01DRAFT_325656 [Xylaria sp. FL0043]
MSLNNEDVTVEVVDSAQDFVAGYHIVSETLGRQVNDTVWQASNPGWDTPEGQAAGVQRMATIPDPNSHDPGRRIIIGFALWIQSATLPEYGIVHSGELRDAMDLDALLPGNKSEQEFLCQMYHCKVRPRLEFLKAKAASSTEPPVILVLGTCATYPSYQRRGIGTKLTQWGLDEARRRGISDVTVEGSRMGRRLYERLGFRPQGQSILYEVDDKFSNREKPSNVFMIYSSETSLSCRVDPLLSALCGEAEMRVFSSTEGLLRERGVYNAPINFPHLGGSLVELADYSASQRPRNLIEVWNDGRDFEKLLTFKAVIIFGLVSVVMSVMQVAIGILQVVVAYMTR